MDDRRGAFEWGLASVLVGGVMSICATQSFSEPPYIQVESLGIDTYYAALAVPAVMQLVAFVGIAGGGRAVLLARRSRRPMALGLAGLLLGIVAMLTWSLIGLTWYGILTPNSAPTPTYIPGPVYGMY